MRWENEDKKEKEVDFHIISLVSISDKKHVETNTKIPRGHKLHGAKLRDLLAQGGVCLDSQKHYKKSLKLVVEKE